MFTGIIQDIASVQALNYMPDGLLKLIIRLSTNKNNTTNNNHALINIGDSIAINGVCLTVVKIDDDILSFDAVPETIDKTNLGLLKVGQSVNIERALVMGDALNGHIVQGHVDAVCRVAKLKQQGDAKTIYFDVSNINNAHYLLAPKGSVALDGVSLTIAELHLDQELFAVAYIPHTLSETTADAYQVNQMVNIEFDILAKQIYHVSTVYQKK